jgi:hypothetical protein
MTINLKGYLLVCVGNSKLTFEAEDAIYGLCHG